MTSSNPLEVLGLAPEALRGRSEQKARRLVQLVGRALLQLEHPDAGGDEERFKNISAAVDELNDAVKFREYRTSYLEPRKTKTEKLASELKTATQAASRARLQRQAYQQLVAGGLERPNVLDLRGFRLTLHQRLEYERAGGAGFVHSKARQAQFFLTLSFLQDGSVVQERNGSETSIRRVPLGCVPKESLKEIGGILPLIRACQPLIGSAAQIKGRTNASAPLGASTVAWSHAEPILSRLYPTIRPESFFFSVVTNGDEPKLYFEGNLFKVEPISP